jgi:adenylate cyclase
LVEFASPVAAVRAAFEIQRDLATQRRRDPETLELRIGLHLADVIVRGDDLLGDGVNVATRIEGMATPGSVTVSQQIFDQVKRAARLTFENLGEHRLKDIPESIRLYRVIGEQDAHSYVSGTPDAAARGTNVPVPPPDRTSIVVLPFVNMSGDPEQDYFADGLPEDLITDLARFKGLFVVSRNASFVYRGRDVDPRRVGQEMGGAATSMLPRSHPLEIPRRQIIHGSGGYRFGSGDPAEARWSGEGHTFQGRGRGTMEYGAVQGEAGAVA